tara:strand:- start:807 stop:1109 length:303 start_codon:yes stop_codon:yes gene_type:complete
MQLDSKLLNEDGHTDVASAKTKMKIAQEAINKMKEELDKLPDDASLPSWWTDKVAIAVDKLDGMADYIDAKVESTTNEDKKKKQLKYKDLPAPVYGKEAY